ncbi:MAG: hypothetical protein WAK95_03600 [Desulfobacterales bacterium]
MKADLQCLIWEPEPASTDGPCPVKKSTGDAVTFQRGLSWLSNCVRNRFSFVVSSGVLYSLFFNLQSVTFNRREEAPSAESFYLTCGVSGIRVAAQK